MVGGVGRAADRHRAQSQKRRAEQAGPPAQTPQGPTQGGGEAMSAMDRIDALVKLGELHDSGVLTDEQFEAEKEKLI